MDKRSFYKLSIQRVILVANYCKAHNSNMRGSLNKTRRRNESLNVCRDSFNESSMEQDDVCTERYREWGTNASNMYWVCKSRILTRCRNEYLTTHVTKKEREEEACTPACVSNYSRKTVNTPEHMLQDTSGATQNPLPRNYATLLKNPHEQEQEK